MSKIFDRGHSATMKTYLHSLPKTISIILQRSLRHRTPMMVVKLLLSSWFVTTIACVRADAQSVSSYGIKLGACLATQTWRYPNGTDPQTRFRWGSDAGIFLEIFAGGPFSISVEAHYLQKGLKYDIPITTDQFPDGTGEFIIVRPRLDYLSFPVLLRISLDLEAVKLYSLLGPRYDKLIAQDGDTRFDFWFDEFKRSDLGISIGLGLISTTLLKIPLGLELKYSPSFKDGYSDQFQAFRNQSFEILLVFNIV